MSRRLAVIFDYMIGRLRAVKACPEHDTTSEEGHVSAILVADECELCAKNIICAMADGFKVVGAFPKGDG